MFKRKRHTKDWEIVITEEDLNKKRKLEDEWYFLRKKYYEHFNDCFPTMMIHTSLKVDIEMIKKQQKQTLKLRLSYLVKMEGS